MKQLQKTYKDFTFYSDPKRIFRNKVVIFKDDKYVGYAEKKDGILKLYDEKQNLLYCSEKKFLQPNIEIYQLEKCCGIIERELEKKMSGANEEKR